MLRETVKLVSAHPHTIKNISIVEEGLKINFPIYNIGYKILKNICSIESAKKIGRFLIAV